MVKGITINKALDLLRHDDEQRRRGPTYDETMQPSEAPKYARLRGALCTLCNVRPGTLPPAQTVFYKFRAQRGRNVGGKVLDRNPGGDRVWFARVIAGVVEAQHETTNGASHDSPLADV